MPFTDNFNRADENLEADANWTLVDGAAGGLKIVSNVLKVDTTQSTGSYHCPDQSTTDHYTQCVFNSSAESFLLIRADSGSNFIGLRHTSGAWQAYKRVSGGFTLLGSYTATLTGGDVGYIEADSGDNITAKVNGIVRVGPLSETYNNTITRQGLSPRNSVIANWIGDFEAGALSAAITGTSATTNAADTHTATGELTNSGTSATTNAADTQTASGTLEASGAAATTNAPDGQAAAGELTNSGTAATTNAADSQAAAGILTVVGTAATANADDTHAASGTVSAITAIIGTSATTNAPDIHSALGFVGVDITPPTTAGLEFEVGSNRLHFEASSNKLDYSVEYNRLHYEVTE